VVAQVGTRVEAGALAVVGVAVVRIKNAKKPTARCRCFFVVIGSHLVAKDFGHAKEKVVNEFEDVFEDVAPHLELAVLMLFLGSVAVVAQKSMELLLLILFFIISSIAMLDSSTQMGLKICKM